MNKTEGIAAALLVLGFADLGIARAIAQSSSGAPASVQTTPAWKRAVRLPDGRTFVSDGAIALDAELAKPAARPSQDLGEASAKTIEAYLTADLPDEFGLSQLTHRGDVYVAPSGLTLNPVYVEYLRGSA
jgi:hypothetical protein